MQLIGMSTYTTQVLPYWASLMSFKKLGNPVKIGFYDAIRMTVSVLNSNLLRSTDRTVSPTVLVDIEPLKLLWKLIV